MRTTHVLTATLIALLLPAGCGGNPAAMTSQPATTATTAPAATAAVSGSADTVTAAEASPGTLSPCELTADMAGETVRVRGMIILLDTSDPAGTYAALEDGACRAGVWVNGDTWAAWSGGERAMLQPGNELLVHGELRVFGDELIVELDRIPVQILPAPTDAGAAPEELAIPDAESLPAEVRLEVPLVYSGVGEAPSLCYLGAFAMLAGYEQPGVTFDDVIACGELGGSAVCVEPPGQPSLLSNGVWTGGIIGAAGRLGMDLGLGYGEGGYDSDPGNPSGPRFAERAAVIYRPRNGDEALAALRAVLTAGHPVEVHLDIYDVYDDFAARSDHWARFMGKDHADHYMTVTGYDADTIYLNDPTDPTPAAAGLAASTGRFLAAWEGTVELPENPMGPYWMVWLEGPGASPPPEEVIAGNLAVAAGTPDAVRRFAGMANGASATRFQLGELSRAREAFAGYLAAHGYTEAAALYETCAEAYLAAATAETITADMMTALADAETAALASLTAITGG
jgi:hypothetical protein